MVVSALLYSSRERMGNLPDWCLGDRCSFTHVTSITAPQNRKCSPCHATPLKRHSTLLQLKYNGDIHVDFNSVDVDYHVSSRQVRPYRGGPIRACLTHRPPQPPSAPTLEFQSRPFFPKRDSTAISIQLRKLPRGAIGPQLPEHHGRPRRTSRQAKSRMGRRSGRAAARRAAAALGEKAFPCPTRHRRRRGIRLAS